MCSEVKMTAMISRENILRVSEMEEREEPRPEADQWWGVAWAWVGGYSAASTLVIIFNIIIVFSVITNKYLHYSYNYVVVMLSLRLDYLYSTSPQPSS